MGMEEHARKLQMVSEHKNRTGDNGGRCHLFVKAPRPKGANVVDVLLAGRSTRFPGPGAFPRRLHVTRWYGWRRLRGLGSRRTDPDFDEVCVAIATIDDDDALTIDSARGVDGQRIVIINGGYRDADFIEIWICPPGAKPPQSTPTVPPGDVQPARERTRPRKPRRPASE